MTTTWRLQPVACEAAGMRLRAFLGGSERPGTTAVLVGGLGVSARYMFPTARAVAGTMPVAIPEMPGVGGSERPRRPLSVPALTDVLAAWVRAHARGPVVLVANSFGCQLAVRCAAREHSLVAGVVLLGPTVDAAARTFVSQAARLALDAIVEPPSLVPIAVGDYVRAGPLRLLGTARAALADEIERHLPSVRAPTVVARGQLDPIVPRAWALRVAALLPRSSFVEVPGAGHALNYNAPADVAAIVRRLLAAI